MKKTPWDNLKNILCVRLDSIGDVLMTSAAIRNLRLSFPKAKITLLTSPGGAIVAEFMPSIDAVISAHVPWMKNPDSGSKEDHKELIAQIEEGCFDAAFIFTVYSQNPLPAAYLCYLAGIPNRVAFCRENPYQLLTHWFKEMEPEHELRHEVRRQLDLIAATGCRIQTEDLELAIPKETFLETIAIASAHGLNIKKPWVIFHAGATASSRRYHPKHFAVLAGLFEEQGFQVVMTGEAGERLLTEQIRAMAKVPIISLTGMLDFAQYGALIGMAPLLISNNTSAVHIASAYKTPVVDLYALTNPQHVPWQVRSRTLFKSQPCGFCYQSKCRRQDNACLQIEPREVLGAALMLLDAAAERVEPGAIEAYLEHKYSIYRDMRKSWPLALSRDNSYGGLACTL